MNNDRFDINSFVSPSAAYAPVYVWVWNDICTKTIIDNQLSEMQNLGIRAFYILPEPKNFRPDSMPTNLYPEYLSEEYSELCTYAVRKGKELGMRCWIYDEGGWPSGSACGKVIKDRPEYARQVLKFSEHSFCQGEVYEKSSSDVLASFIDDRSMIDSGYMFSEDAVVTEYYTEKENSDYPDLLNKKATEYFIEITHEKYTLDNITAVFTDEPKASLYSFNNELAELFEKKYGESVLPYLPLIARKAAPTEENVHILQRWYDLCSKMFCENYLLPCRKWANDHGLAFTGHMDVDHRPDGCINGGANFNLMRALRCLDIPGVDVIWRQLCPENMIIDKNEMNGYNGFFPRYASSAAAHNGSKLAMSEIFGVAGAAVTYDIMRFIVGYQAVRGITVFNPFNFPLGRKGALLAQELPVFTENQPYYKFFSQFNRYVERMSYISSLGERVCSTGLYYPVSDFQGGLYADVMAEKFDILGRTLEDMLVDFDIIDDDAIQLSHGVDKGSLCIGNAVYKHIVIPEGAFIPEDTQNMLNRFVRGGGRVLHCPSEIEPVISVDGEGIRAMHRKAENAEIYFLFREKGHTGEYKVHLPSTDGYLLDLTNGELQHFDIENGILKLSLATGETAVILLTDEQLNAESKKEFRVKNDIGDSFMFRKELELSFDENGFRNIKHSENEVPVRLGNWDYLVGNDYSGSCVYETTFIIPDEKTEREAEIDLGEVHYSADVFLNGQHIGSAIMPPYRLRIPCGVLKKENKLKIVVTNTSANLYVHTDYFDKWKTEELSPYFAGELEYAKDFVSGGLYGPVALYTE